MKNLINKLNLNSIIKIKGKDYIVRTKTWYSIKEDTNALYVKCELSDNKILVLIPEDDLIYIGNVIENMKYEKISEDKIKYNNVIFNKSGEGNQYITNIEFGNKDEIEGDCRFEDYETENNIISLGILTDKGIRADIYANILSIDDIIVK